MSYTHTHGLVDPRAAVVGQEERTDHVVRLCVVRSRDEIAGPLVSRYSAVSVIQKPDDSCPDLMHQAHERITAGALAGDTFEDLGMGVVQNRLFLMENLPAFLIPPYLRALIAPTEQQARWWNVEFYTFYALVKDEDGKEELYYYGTFIEVVPAPHSPPPRQRLGLERIWRKAGLGRRFEEYVQSKNIPVDLKIGHVPVAERARLLGWLAGLPALYGFSILGRSAWRRSKC